jgi:WD40 repeat protein
VLAAAETSGPLLIAGAIIGGAGFGVAFLGSLRALSVAIPNEHRAQVMSAFYVVAYSSLSLPAVLAGIVVTPLGLESTFEIFGIVVAALALLLAARQQLLEGHDASIAGLTFLADDRLASAGGADGAVKLWTLGDTAEASPLQPTLQDAAAVASHASRASVAAVDGARRMVRVWNLKPPAGAPLALTGHVGGIVELAFAPAGTMIAAATTDDGTVALWDIATGRERFPFGSRPSAGTAVAFSPDGRRFASGSRRDESVVGTVRVWEVTEPSTPSKTVAVHTSSVTTIDFDPRGELLVTAGQLDRQLNLLDIRQQPAPSRTLDTGFDKVVTARFGAGGGYLAWSGPTGTVRVWNRDRAEQNPRNFECGAGTVSALAFSRKTAWLAAGTSDGRVCLWDVGSSAARVIEAGEPITAMALDEPGRLLAAGGPRGLVRLWDLQHLDWDPLTLAGLTSAVTALTFAPDGTRLAGGSDADGQAVLIWPSTATLADAVCTRYQRALTADEWRHFVDPDLPPEPTCPAR